MPRITRGLADNSIYHVINRGNGRQEVFRKEQDYDAFIEIVREAKERYDVKVFAYCLMPNHFHMALSPQVGGDLSKLMQWLMTSHVRKYHRHYGGSGHIWQGRYKSFIVQEDIHLLMVMRYIEGNPVRAQLVTTAKEWRWSSHMERLGRADRMLISKAPIDMPAEWDKYVDDRLTAKEMERIRESVNRQAPYGEQAWQLKTSEELGLESSIRQRGRTRKDQQYEKK